MSDPELKYYILVGTEVVPADLMTWAAFFEKPDRILWKTKLYRDAVLVSTVFLGLDHSFDLSEGHPPLLFETMIFGGKYDQYQDRYSTYEEAQAGHARAIKVATGKLKVDADAPDE